MASEAELWDKFRVQLRTRGLKYTTQRDAIARVFFCSGQGHQTLDELLVRAKALKPEMGYATIYRTMKLMVECGVALEHRFVDSGMTRFEPNLEDEHHDHIICLTCGRIVEFEDSVIEGRQERIAQENGFVVKKHRLEIYGECITENCVYRNPLTNE